MSRSDHLPLAGPADDWRLITEGMLQLGSGRAPPQSLTPNRRTHNTPVSRATSTSRGRGRSRGLSHPIKALNRLVQEDFLRTPRKSSLVSAEAGFSTPPFVDRSPHRRVHSAPLQMLTVDLSSSGLSFDPQNFAVTTPERLSATLSTKKVGHRSFVRRNSDSSVNYSFVIRRGTIVQPNTYLKPVLTTPLSRVNSMGDLKAMPTEPSKDFPYPEQSTTNNHPVEAASLTSTALDSLSTPSSSSLVTHSDFDDELDGAADHSEFRTSTPVQDRHDLSEAWTSANQSPVFSQTLRLVTPRDKRMAKLASVLSPLQPRRTITAFTAADTM